MRPQDRILSLLRLAPRPLRAKEIGDICGVWTASLYLGLLVLERLGQIESEWEFPYQDHPRSRIYFLKKD